MLKEVNDTAPVVCTGFPQSSGLINMHALDTKKSQVWGLK
jgi:hypothetical protein